MFSTPRVDAQHLAKLVGTGAFVCIVGRLSEVRIEEYNQECIVQMHDGTAIKVINGPVSERSQ